MSERRKVELLLQREKPGNFTASTPQTQASLEQTFGYLHIARALHTGIPAGFHWSSESTQLRPASFKL